MWLLTGRLTRQNDPLTRELTLAEAKRAEYMSIYLSATGITTGGAPKVI